MKNSFYFLLVILFFSCGNAEEKKKLLPYFGPREVSPESEKDTIYHVVPEFGFLNQDGKFVTQDNFKDKIYIANFFFTSCPSICPKMMTELKRFRKITDEKNMDVMIISHTVDPKRDSVETLKRYADKNAINTEKWHLVTGDKDVIYDLGMEGYFLSAGEDAEADGGFLHSEIVVLVDKEKHIRGLYTGTKTKEIDRLISDLEILIKEYE